MPQWATRGLGLLVLFGTMALHPMLGAAHGLAGPESSGIVHRPDGSILLSTDAPTPPPSFAPFARMGLYDSAVTAPAHAFSSVAIDFTATVPAGTQAMIAVRAQSSGGQWQAWTTDLQPRQQVEFDSPQARLQYRVVLLGSRAATPVVSAVTLAPNVAPAQLRAAGRAVAPTYRLRITRQGMVGGRTANGHIITKNDVFVSLPSWSSLSSKDGSEYQVRLTANGRSVIAPVYDVGPWNHHDNYWDTERDTYASLPTGWPEDHAAYYEGYNRRMADEGWVRFPTAVDIGDGAYWALGLKGAQGVVDVTFLWLGDDPGANATPRNSDPSQRPTGGSSSDDGGSAAPPATPKPTAAPAPTATAAPVHRHRRAGPHRRAAYRHPRAARASRGRAGRRRV